MRGRGNPFSRFSRLPMSSSAVPVPPPSSLPAVTVLCRRIRVRGLVQGVGYRPFVYRLAFELGLSGWVRNDAEGVDIEARGPAPLVERFVARLRAEAPELARVEAVEVREAAPERGLPGFLIVESRGGQGTSTRIGPDSALCHDCLVDLFTPGNRRQGYAFTHCTHCGPRYSITRELPYDRARTSLAPFAQCPDCLAEYTDPRDRRFHAEANCCPACGPQLALLGADGAPLADGIDDPVAGAVRLLQSGAIVAIKGYGGFHLACDARNPAAVAELRRRKHREEKPFAVMVVNVASAAAVADLSGPLGAEAAGLLELPERSVVLLRKGTDTDAALPGVAPGLAWIGAMLPYAPLHYLLFHAAAGRPAGLDWLGTDQPLVLVMTSANPHGEPLVTGNAEAVQRLAGIADAFLLHDRDIVIRSDDSVIRLDGGGVQFVRRGRGQTPRPIKLKDDGPTVLAFGGYLKNTVCVMKGREAILSQHVGDLDSPSTVAFLEETVDHLLHVLDATPDLVAHDRHPDFPSTRLAQAFAAAQGIPALAVGHHHAHIAAVLAESGTPADHPVLGLALDGVGLGDDGSLWGGELLEVSGAGCTRLAGLTPLHLPGGDKAAREPWRLAASALHRLGRGDEIEAFVARRHPGQEGAAVIARMLAQGVNCPPTSSLGRLFDAAAGLLGLRAVQRFEAQAAMELEGRADRQRRRAGHAAAPLAGGWVIDTAGALDFAPLLAALADWPVEVGERESTLDAAADLFHATVATGLADWAARAAQSRGLGTVALGGGCCLNALLAADLRVHLNNHGLAMLEARQAPPNDGGLALGQAWAARHHAHD